jgi:hypothetical protein
MFTFDELQTKFREFDIGYFGGRLYDGGTQARVMSSDDLRATLLEMGRTKEAVRIPDDIAEDGLTSPDGSVIWVNPEGDHDWQCTLLHEMVHAYEKRFGARMLKSEEGRAAAAWSEGPLPKMCHVVHSAQFFTKLFEIMRARGHDPAPGGDDFSLYFG